MKKKTNNLINLVSDTLSIRIPDQKTKTYNKLKKELSKYYNKFSINRYNNMLYITCNNTNHIIRLHVNKDIHIIYNNNTCINTSNIT